MQNQLSFDTQAKTTLSRVVIVIVLLQLLAVIRSQVSHYIQQSMGKLSYISVVWIHERLINSFLCL